MIARAVCLVLGLVVPGVAAQAEPTVLYARATPLDARSGVVEIRTAQEALVDVPVDCAGAEPQSFGCTSAERFARVYGLTFALERREARGGAIRVTREDRGQAYLFLHADRDDLAAFDEDLRSVLGGLGADAFADAFANLNPQGLPFSRIATVSTERSWSCFESGSARSASRYERQIETGSDGTPRVVSGGTSTSTLPGLTEPLCREGSSLLGSTPPEEVRTMPSARALREETVLVASVDQLPDTARGEDLLPLPPGFSYTTRRRPGVVASASQHRQDGRVRAASTRDGVEIEASAEPASFSTDVVAMHGWLARWTIDTVDRTLGARPGETRGTPLVLRSAIVPVLPPTPLDEEGRPAASPPETVEPRFDADVYLAAIAERLDRAALLDAGTLARAVAKEPAGLRSSGFALFVCRERDATFELLPTGASTDVLNAGELCAAIDRTLARAGVE